MTFLREKRILLGLLAFLAPLPLPFNEPRPEGVVGLPFIVLYELMVLFFLFRSARGAQRWLGPFLLNALAIAYLPFFYLDLQVFYSGALVRPMMHLVLFALTAKLFSIERERDKWHVFVATFFVFITAMATSAGPGIVFYLLCFLGLAIAVLSRFAMFHVRSMAGDLHAATTIGLRERRPALVWLTVLAILVSIPLFVLLPRLRDPFIMGSGASSGGIRFMTGFSDEANLDMIGNIRSNDAVALRAQFDEGRQVSEDLRLKALAYDRYSEKRWLRSRRDTWERLEPTQGVFRLSQQRPEKYLHIWLQPIGSLTLIGPAEMRSVQFLTPAPTALALDAGGSMFLPTTPFEVTEYQLGLGPLTRPELNRPPEADDFTLDTNGVTSRMSDLAATVAVGSTVLERVRKLESHLTTEYQYTLELFGLPSENPIDNFLFQTRQGHCEYFASAMVMMLRSQGIPARFVTGFLGGEYNPLEGYYVVRQNNAHAWVEAYIPDLGWQVFDPTPPAGRPAGFERSLLTFGRQAYDWIQFRWDRYVISYGAADQQRLIRRFASFWASLWEKSKDEAPDSVGEASGLTIERERFWPPWTVWIPAAVVAGLFLGWWLLRRERSLSATQAYLRLRQLARKQGLDVVPSTSADAFHKAFAERFPDSEDAAGQILELYLRESYREDDLSSDDTQVVNALLQEASRDLRKAS